MSRNISIMLISLAVILFVVFLWLPEYNMFGRLNNELGMKIAQVDPENAYYAKVASAYEYIENNQATLIKVDDALPEATDLSKIIYFLEQKALQSGMSLKNVVLSKSAIKSQAPKNGTVKETIVSVSVSGSYESLNKFIVALEKSDRIFEVTNVSFSSPVPTTRIVNNQVQTLTSPFDFNMQVKTHSY